MNRVSHKSIFCLILVIALFASAFPVYAQSAESVEIDPRGVTPEEFFAPSPKLSHEEIVELVHSQADAITINEYDMLMERKAEAANTIMLRSTTLEERAEAEKILKLDPAEEIYILQEKTDEELMDLGYDPERIDLIRDFQGSEAELRALAADVTVWATDKYTKNESGRWAKVNVFFSWTGVPRWNFSDGLAAGATTGYYIERVPDTSCTVYYTAHGAAGSQPYEKTYTSNSMVINPFSPQAIQGFGFPNTETKVVSGGREIVYYAGSGAATFVYRTVGSNRQVQLSYCHAHTKIGITLNGISFSSSGSVVTLSFGLERDYNVVPRALDTYTFPS